MRYRKQGFEIPVPIPDGVLGPDSIPEITAAFERVYEQLYGHTIPDTPIDVMSWRVLASGPKPDFRLPEGSAGGGGALKGTRRIYVPEAGPTEAKVYDRYRLSAGELLQGPAIIEERESTAVVNGPGRMRVDDHRNLIVDMEGAS